MCGGPFQKRFVYPSAQIEREVMLPVRLPLFRVSGVLLLHLFRTTQFRPKSQKS